MRRTVADRIAELVELVCEPLSAWQKLDSRLLVSRNCSLLEVTLSLPRVVSMLLLVT
jgi:hypothetical protein